MPAFFRRYRPPNLLPKIDRHDRFRGSAAERGYDGNWQKLASAYRREHPFCEECERRGRIEIAAVVDHMVPVRLAPELRLEWDNVWSLCAACHAWKYRMERYAEASNGIGKLQQWCRDPETRPKPFRIPQS